MMKYTYVLLGCVFMLIAWIIIQRLGFGANRRMLVVAAFCYMMMVVFNTYLTSLPIVRYDWNKVLGLKMISWPIEDIAYLVVGLYMAQALYAAWLSHYEQKTSSPTPSTSKVRNKL